MHFSDLSQYSNHLKVIWIDTKKGDRALIKNCSREYKKKRVPISTQKYYHVSNVEESVFDHILKIKSEKVMTTTHVNDFVGTFVMKLRVVEGENHFY